MDAASSDPARPALDATRADGSTSETIDTLLNRRSVLAGTGYDPISQSVMAANSRAAEAELRAAMLRSEARSRNWLPRLGPNVSLSDMGDMVASLVVDAVLFDNGGRKAERDFAMADVEVAAVALAQDSNARVLTGLELYLDAEAASARAAAIETALGQMERYEYVMSERVAAGVDDRADLNLVRQKLAQMRSDLASDRAVVAAARAELAAMSAAPLDGISGLADIRPPDANLVALSVMKADAEASRAEAEARAARAGLLPSLGLRGSVDSAGNAGATLNAGSPGGIGLGLGADLRATDAVAEAAQARVGEAGEQAQRRLAQLNADLDRLRREAAEAQVLADQARANFAAFADQQRAGLRSVPELVGVLETRLAAERRAVELPYQVARVELQIAALYGALVDGEAM
ncbi:MAG: type 1 adhesin secretion system secretin component LapE [Rhodobacteraceae bacterium HLUCCA08]|nr:MAG: type 1 adhesin secretion system secretin component LapE [Rhodobacteraceae bacterium HLUCCA08]